MRKLSSVEKLIETLEENRIQSKIKENKTNLWMPFVNKEFLLISV